MTEKQITIKKVTAKTATASGKKFLIIKDSNNQDYSCWEVKLFPTLEQATGRTLNCRIETKGKWTNILDILPDDGQAVHINQPMAVSPIEARLTKMLVEIDRKLVELKDIVSGLEIAEEPPTPDEIKASDIPF